MPYLVTGLRKASDAELSSPISDRNPWKGNPTGIPIPGQDMVSKSRRECMQEEYLLNVFCPTSLNQDFTMYTIRIAL